MIDPNDMVSAERALAREQSNAERENLRRRGGGNEEAAEDDAPYESWQQPINFGWKLPTFKPVHKTESASRLSFFLAGYLLAIWATLVPFVKRSLCLEEGPMGLLLLCLGLGALISMPMSGVLVGRIGCRRVLRWAYPVAAGLVALLGTSPDAYFTGALLLCFGGAFGIIDVAMSVHAAAVEKRAGSSAVLTKIYAFYPIGGVAGSGLTTLLMNIGLPIIPSVIVLTMLASLVWLYAGDWIIGNAGRDESGGHGFALPRGIVLIYGLVVFVLYLADGAILDWGGLLLTEVHGAAIENAGMGYAGFSIAMTIMRLVGGKIFDRMGPRNIVFVGALIGAAAFVAAVLFESPYVTVFAFFMVGLGISGITPITFSQAGRQNVMPVSQAMAAVSTIGYSGILVGPAMIGAIAQATSLVTAFMVVACLMVCAAFGAVFYPKR